MRRAVVIGTGAYLPERVLANKDIEAMVETTDEWIVTRTGIRERHIAAKGEKTSSLAVRAGRQALENAGAAPESIDLLVLATNTPDDIMPATGPKVQEGLGLSNAAAFDLNAACSGFVYAVGVANGFIASGQADRVLVIGAETFSEILNWQDRGTCILFGDGAAALLLEAQEQPGSAEKDRGVLSVFIKSDGRYARLLGTADEDGEGRQKDKLFMSGKDIFRHAVAKMPEAVEAALAAAGLPLGAVDRLVPHQANQRILKGVAEKLGLGEDKVISTVAGHANTSAASIPLALHAAARDGRIRPGQLVACPALGAGLTWGCFLVRW